MIPESKSTRVLLLLISAAFLLSALACSAQSGPNSSEIESEAFDPASSDLSPFDTSHPPVISEMSFRVEGAKLNAIIYEAQGAGPHPTVLLLHGFPGNERNLDVAQAIRRAGWNVVFFHYRGAWGSGGEFSFPHVIEDVGAVVAAISESEFAEKHRIDAEHLALVGHSMGGFAALVAGAELDAIDCVVSMSGANLGALSLILESDPDQAAGFASSINGWSGPINGPDGEILVAEIVRNADRFNTINHSAVLARKNLLLLAGQRDVVTPASIHHVPLVEALRAAGPKSLESFIFEEADHSYSGQRVALSRRVTSWLQSECVVAD